MGPERYINVNESHIFVFPVVDFDGRASGDVFAANQLKLPSEGNWWIWGVQATRVATGEEGELASGSNLGLNIWDSALSQFWWTGGSANVQQVFPIQLVAGKAGNGAFFSEPKLVRAGSILTPYVNQSSGATPTGKSLLYITLIATLADSSQGELPVTPSLGKVVNVAKGEHYKALVKADFDVTALGVGGTRQFVLPLNKLSSMIIQQVQTDYAFTDTSNADPRISDPHLLANVFDTRTVWKWASPEGCPISLLFGQNAWRPFPAPSFFYMADDQNLVVEFTNNTTAELEDEIVVVFDGFLNQGPLAQRLRP